MDTLLFFFPLTFRGSAAFLHHHQFVALFDAEVEAVRSGFTLRHKGMSSQSRDKSLLSSLPLSNCLSLYSLVGHPWL